MMPPFEVKSLKVSKDNSIALYTENDMGGSETVYKENQKCIY